VQERVQVQVLEQVLVPERALEQVLEQVRARALEQVLVPERAQVDACLPVPKQARARAAVTTPHRGTYASDPGRSTSHRTMPATRRIRFLKS